MCILTPTQAAPLPSFPKAPFKMGTIWAPLVTELSKLGL